MDSKAYFDEVAKHLCGDFASAESINAFADNTDVIGAYAEAKVLTFLKRILHPLRISTGTIIAPEYFDTPDERPQFDAIVWDSNPIPAIMEEGDFALVPRNSVVGALEIKRNDYSKGLTDISDRAETAQSELPSGSDGFLGVVCVREKHKSDGRNKLTDLIEKGRAVFLIDYIDGSATVNPQGVYDLVNFIGRLRKFHKNWTAEFHVNYPG